MNYDNAQHRLRLIYASIKQKHDYGIAAIERVNTRIEGEKIRTVTISFFNKNEEPEVLNQINNVISNLSNLKDCLKNILKKKGKDGKIIEKEIDNSIYLQLVIALSNQEKHGYPLKNRRSKKDPQIKNINRGFTASDRADNLLVKKSDGSSMKNCMVKIIADITDNNGNFLYRLDDLVENALSDWEKIIKKYNII